jgi:hypothetical protein
VNIPRLSGKVRAAIVAGALGSSGISACGLGTYDDTGSAMPGSSWWSWMCPDGGQSNDEAGCVGLLGACESDEAGSDGYCVSEGDR